MEITNLLTPNHQRAHHHNQPHNTPPHHRQLDHLYGTTSPSRYASSVKSLPSLGSSSGYDQHRSVLPSGPNAFSSSSSSPMSHSPNSVQLPPLRDTFKDYLGNDPQQPSSSSYGLQQQQQQQQSHSQYQHSNTQQSPSHHRYLSGYRTHANSSTLSLPSYHHSSTPSTPLPVLHSLLPPGLTAGPTHQSSRHMPPQLSSSSSPASSAPSSSYHIPQQHQQQQHQFALEEEEDLIDPQHRSLPLSSSHQSMTSTISEEEEEEEQEGQWDVTQYIRWVNSYLPPGKKVVDLASAFRNGDALILLLETISQKTVRRPKFSETHTLWGRVCNCSCLNYHELV